MIAALTPEAFLALPPDPDEDAEETQADPLASIAESLRAITEVVVRRDTQEAAEDESKQALDQLDAEYAELEKLHDAKQQLIEDTLAICAKSTSKLANSIRALLEPVVTVEVPEPEPAPEPEPVLEQPAHDADVQEWRAYARNLGHGRTGPAFNDLEQMNRSQIRTLLGIEQPGGES